MTAPRMQDPPRFNREWAKANGYSDEEIDRYLAQAENADPIAAARRKLNAQGTPSESTGTRATVRDATPEQVTANREANARLATGLARQLGQGASFGFADEIEGGVRAALGPDDYRTARDRVRSENAAFSAENPVLSAGANLAGGLTSGVGAARLASKVPALVSAGLAPRVSGGETAIQRVLQGAKMGGVGGALTGAGLAPEKGDLVEYTAGGGLTGAALGAALPAIGNVVRGARNVAAGIGQQADEASGPIRRMVQADDPQQRAIERVLQRMRAGGQSVDDLRAASQAAPEPAALAELIPDNRGVQGLRIARNVGRERDAIDRALAERAADEGDRFAEVIRQRSGVMAPRDPVAVAEEAKQAVQPEVERLIALARQNPDVPADELLPMLEDLRGLRRGREALGRAGELSRGFGTLQDIDPQNPTVSVANLHNLRQGLDYAIDRATQEQDGQMVAILQQRRAAVDDMVKAAGGEPMQEADRLFADAMGRGESFRAGQRVEQAGSEEAIQRLLAEARDPAMFRQGAASRQLERLSNVADGEGGQIRNPVQGVVGSPLRRARAAVAYENPEDFAAVQSSAEDIVNRLRTRQAVSGNSTTAANLSEAADEFMGDPTAFLRAPLSPVNWAKMMGERGLRAATQGLNARQATDMGRILGAGLPGQMTRDEALALLEQMTPAIRQQLERQLITSGALSRAGASGVLRQ